MINDAIRAETVRVVGSNRERLGIMSRTEAQKLADDKDLDLVLIAPQGDPPVVRMMDYSKYRFEMIKKEKEARKNQKVITVKEVKLSPVIEEHDISVRERNARKFLEDGNKVKVSIQFRGRQMAHQDVGLRVLVDFAKRIEDVAVVDRRPSMEGRIMSMMISPIKEKKA